MHLYVFDAICSCVIILPRVAFCVSAVLFREIARIFSLEAYAKSIFSPVPSPSPFSCPHCTLLPRFLFLNAVNSFGEQCKQLLWWGFGRSQPQLPSTMSTVSLFSFRKVLTTLFYWHIRDTWTLLCIISVTCGCICEVLKLRLICAFDICLIIKIIIILSLQECILRQTSEAKLCVTKFEKSDDFWWLL